MPDDVTVNQITDSMPENDPSLSNNRGLANCNLHDYKEAVIHFENALKVGADKDEEYAKLWNNKGLALYYFARNYYLTKPSQENVDDHQARKNLYDQAADSFDKALAIDPKFSDAWNNKGITISALGWKDEAIRCFNKAIEAEPKNAKAWNNLGRSFSNREKYEEAINYYDKADSLIDYYEDKQTYADVLTNKGIAFTKLGKYAQYFNWYEKAAACFKRALEIDPNNVNALNHKAILYLERGDETRAEEIIEESLNIQTKYYAKTGKYQWNMVETLDKKAVILIHLEKYNEAMKCLEKAKEYDPEYQAIYVHMGYTKFRRKKYDDAIFYYDEAIKSCPRFAEAHAAKALAYYEKKDYKSAISEAAIAVEIKPSLSVAVENLSRLVSHDSNGLDNQTFWDFWTGSPIKKAVAIILAVLAAGLIGYHFYMLQLQESVSISRSFEIPATYLTLIGIILFVLLVPQINKAKLGSFLEVEFQPHYHPTTEAPSLSGFNPL
jgi:tetratricopeptide (TPR) repeat protein